MVCLFVSFLFFYSLSFTPFLSLPLFPFPFPFRLHPFSFLFYLSFLSLSSSFFYVPFIFVFLSLSLFRSLVLRSFQFYDQGIFFSSFYFRFCFNFISLFILDLDLSLLFFIGLEFLGSLFVLDFGGS